MTEPDRARLDAAYRATSYEAGPFRIRVGRSHPTLDLELARMGADAWAFLTAVNPRSRVLGSRENAQRMQALHDALRGRVLVEGLARPASGDWPVEPSVLVLGIAEEEAVALARRFDQNALVVGRRDEDARLVWVV